MRIFLAPMEEVTGHVFRRCLEQHFGGIDKYYTPFIAPASGRMLRTRELKEIAPENNEGLNVVPQILTSDAGLFLKTALELADRGYREVNLNVGCPSATVVNKHRGSALLKEKDSLKSLLSGIFDGMEADPGLKGMSVSVKTRTGFSSAEELPELLELFSGFPVSELIIHARVREAYYRGLPDLDAFDAACRFRAEKGAGWDLCYNGNIRSADQYKEICSRFPAAEAVMIGRGLVRNPGLAREIRTGEKMTKQELRVFHDSLYAEYCSCLGSWKDALYKMKEVWFYLGSMFEDSAKTVKKLNKADRPEKYLAAVQEIFCHELTDTIPDTW